MGVCSSATVPVMAITEEADTTRHQPMTETNVKLNEVVVTGLTGHQKLGTSAAPISIVSSRQLEAQPSTNIIDAIHQTGRTFKYFDRVNRRCVYLNSVLIAPLLTFLTHTVVYHHYTIISHSAYNGL